MSATYKLVTQPQTIKERGGMAYVSVNLVYSTRLFHKLKLAPFDLIFIDRET